MKTKDLILIILGTLLFISGVAYNSLNRGAPAVVDDGVLSKNEAKSIAQSLISKVIYVYEQPSKVFDVEEKSNEDGTKTSTLKNYNDIVKGIFSEKGIKQLESMKFNSKLYINKDQNIVTVTDVIPDNNKFYNSSYSITEIKIGKDYFTCKVNFYRANTNSNDTLVYYAVTKNLRVVKDGDNYLVDNIIYSNK